MTRSAYYITGEATEDRFDEADSLDEAISIARCLVKEGESGNPVLIEYNGRVIRQLVLTSDGAVEEAAVC